jgi:hypothetical protein
VLGVLNAPDRTEKNIDNRRNAYKVIDNRLLTATYLEEEGDVVVVTVIAREGVGESR